MFKLPIDKLDALFAAVASASTLYLPVDGNDGRSAPLPALAGGP